MADLEAGDPMPLPYVVKPVNEGSSVGVTVVRGGDNRRAEIARDWSFGPAALVEEYIPGRELTVGVLDDRALAVTEIRAVAGSFYDYESKYADGGSRHIIPAVMHPDAYAKAMDVAVAAHQGAGLPRRDALRFPLRRHRGRTRPAGAAGDQYPAGPDADLAAAGTGGASGHELPAAVRLDGGERRMPRVKRSPRNSVNDRPSGWRLVLRRQRRLLKPAGMGRAPRRLSPCCWWLSFHSAGAARHRHVSSCGSGWALATAASGLRVTDIVIEGRANTPEPLLRAAIGVNKGDPILGFSLEETRARIETIPWVEHATVERRLPGTVVVNLQERRPFAIWQNQGKFVLVDRSRPGRDQPGRRAVSASAADRGPGRADAAAGLLDALSDRPALAEKVVASVRVGERRWNLRMNNGTDVMLPEGHEVAALDRLMQLQQQHAVLDRPLAAIDMRLPDRLVFRPKPEAKEVPVVPPVPPGVNPPTVPVIAKKPT